MKYTDPIPESFKDGIALALLELRQKHKYSQGEAAKFCGMSQANLSRIEKGDTEITMSQLAMFSSVYGVSPLAIVGAAIAKLRQSGTYR